MVLYPSRQTFLSYPYRGHFRNLSLHQGQTRNRPIIWLYRVTSNRSKWLSNLNNRPNRWCHILYFCWNPSKSVRQIQQRTFITFYLPTAAGLSVYKCFRINQRIGAANRDINISATVLRVFLYVRVEYSLFLMRL